MPKAKQDTGRFEKQEKRRLRNRSVRAAVKTYISRAREVIGMSSANAEETLGAIKRAVSELDRAARKGVIHKNNAARRKSRLMKRLHATEAAA